MLPVKRTVKYHKVFCARASFAGALASLSGELPRTHFHRRQNAEVSLDSPVVVVVDVTFNRLYKGFSGSKAPAIVAFPFQDAPEAFHRPIVNAVGHPGHALHHALVNQFPVEDMACVLESPVAMEDGLGIRVVLNCQIEGIKYQFVVVGVSQYVRHDPSVTEIQDGAEIDLVHLNPFIPTELCHVRQPFLVRSVRVELAVQNILGRVLGIPGTFGTSLVPVLNRGEKLLLPADPQHPLVRDHNAVVVFQLVPQPSVTHFRMFFMDYSNLLGYFGVLNQPFARFSLQPYIVCRSGYLQDPASKFNRYPFLLGCLPDRAVLPFLPYL